jgi:radical SAM superfamily enzyme YgiQ (UPF0313 family)
VTPRNPAPAFLRAPGAILLVSCYELGHQPLGLAVPLAFLERAGFAPEAVDLAVEPLDEAKVRRARFVALSVPMHTALRIGVRAAERVRALNAAAAVCFYGLYAVLNRDHLLEHGADAVLGGESEQQLVDAARRIERGETLESPAPCLARLDFPVPSRDRLPPLARYAHLERDGALRPAAAVEASRGCRHRCLHCPITPVYGGRFFVVPEAVVLEDVRRQVARGARHITFTDPDFLNGPGHSLRIAEAMHAEFPDVTFDFTAKVEHLIERRDLLPRLAARGCVFVVSAVESLSDVVLRNLEKGHTRADVGRALDAVRTAGLTLRPSLLPFTPWTTLDDYVELVEWVAGEDLVEAVDPVQLAIRLLIPPGSALLRRPEIRPFLAGLDPAAFTYVWRHPDPRMEGLHKIASGIVHAASHAGETATATFGRVRAAAHAAREDPAPAEASATHAERRPVPPRLTEPWFC